MQTMQYFTDSLYFSRELPKEKRKDYEQDNQHKAKSSKAKERKPDYSKQRQNKRMEMEYWDWTRPVLWI